MRIKAVLQSILEDLQSVEGFSDLVVAQTRPEVLVSDSETGLDHPYLVWEITDHTKEVCLDKSRGKRDIEVTIDLWTNDSTEGENLFDELESLMLENDYVLVFSSDIPDPENICHINTKFIY